MAPADSLVSDACREQRCLNIFARIRNLSFIIRRPSFNLEMIGQIAPHWDEAKENKLKVEHRTRTFNMQTV